MFVFRQLQRSLRGSIADIPRAVNICVFEHIIVFTEKKRQTEQRYVTFKYSTSLEIVYIIA